MEEAQKERNTFKKSSEQQQVVITEMVEQLEIKSKEKTGYELENESLTEKVKELQNDNALLFKKVTQLQ